MVIFISLLPLLLCLTFALVGYAHFSFIKLNAANLCRKNLLTGQDQIKNELRKLLRMNPRAKSLRRIRRMAELALKAAKATGQPGPIGFALIALNLVKIKQGAFAAKQLLTQANAHKINLTYRNKFKSEINKLTPNVKAKVSHFPFAVEKVQKNELTPDYKVKINFSKRQKAKASWEIKNYNFIFLNSFINLKKMPVITGHCQASIEKRGTSWQAYLMKKGTL